MREVIAIPVRAARGVCLFPFRMFDRDNESPRFLLAGLDEWQAKSIKLALKNAVKALGNKTDVRPSPTSRHF